MQSRRQFLKNTGAVLATSLLMCQTKTNPPNFLVILLDDLGWSDLGCHGNSIISTPNIDKLASESVRFQNFYVNPVCAPTRAGLLTGRHFLRTGVAHVHGGKDFVHLEETLLPEYLKQQGYATGMWGKWHSGHAAGYFPWERGFDQAYMAQLYQHKNNSGDLNGIPVEHNKWADAVIADYAIDFIRRHKDGPFFAFLSFLTPHAPLVARPELIEKYQNKNLSKNLATLYAMIENCDAQIGRVLAALDEMAPAENTVVLFFSDNGPAVNNAQFTDADREIRYVNDLKGHKGNLWENGVKSPLFVRWPQRFQPGEVERLADVTDILPTLLEMAGAGIPNDLDGRSILAYLRGDEQKLPERLSFNYANIGWPPTDKPWTPEGVHDEYRPVPPEQKQNLKWREQIISVRGERYKLMMNPGTVNNQPPLVDGFALFDIQKDPLETTNLFRQKPDIADSLKVHLEAWFEKIKSAPHSFAMPTFRIGETGKPRSVVPAKAPMRISPNLKNTFNMLSHWARPGDYAEYKINVLNAGDYTVHLEHDDPDVSVEFRISAAGFASTLRLKGQQQTPAVLSLPRGESILRLELLQVQRPMNALSAIILKRD